jgi:hypothetical protein
MPDKKIGELDFKPLGGGSGMIGLPGDSHPPPDLYVPWHRFDELGNPLLASLPQ